MLVALGRIRYVRTWLAGWGCIETEAMLRMPFCQHRTPFRFLSPYRQPNQLLFLMRLRLRCIFARRAPEYIPEIGWSLSVPEAGLVFTRSRWPAYLEPSWWVWKSAK